MEYHRVNIPLDLIAMPTFLLRDIRTDSPKYAELLRSVKEHGILNSVLVRPRKGGGYQLVDGAYRLTATRDAGLPDVPAIVKDLTDEEVLALQIQTNSIFVDTTTIEYAKHLLRVQQAYPGITIPRMARLVSKSAFWVKQQLSLLDLDEKIQPMVDRGEVSLMNAYQLAKLPRHMQIRHLPQAIAMERDEFRTLVGEIVKQLMVDNKQRIEEERLAAKSADPIAYMRSIKEVKAELKTRRQAALLLTRERPKTTLDAFRLALQWVLNLDPRSLEARRARNVQNSFSKLEES